MRFVLIYEHYILLIGFFFCGVKFTFFVSCAASIRLAVDQYCDDADYYRDDDDDGSVAYGVAAADEDHAYWTCRLMRPQRRLPPIVRQM